MLRPHFLFNALNAIARLVDMGRNQEASKAVLALGTLLRQEYIAPEGLITFEEELRVVESYITLQKIRFGDRVQISFDVSPAVREATLPPRILQPLVDNAFSHGIEPKMGTSRLTIQAGIEAGIIIVTIKDDGAGIPTDVLAKFQAWQATGILAEATAEDGCLRGIHRRLQFHFGCRAGLTLQPLATGGTVARMIIPLQRGREPGP